MCKYRYENSKIKTRSASAIVNQRSRSGPLTRPLSRSSEAYVLSCYPAVPAYEKIYPAGQTVSCSAGSQCLSPGQGRASLCAPRADKRRTSACINTGPRDAGRLGWRCSPLAPASQDYRIGVALCRSLAGFCAVRIYNTLGLLMIVIVYMFCIVFGVVQEPSIIFRISTRDHQVTYS